MIAPSAPNQLSLCHLRPATVRDAKAIRQLTRRLHKTAVPQPKWQEWIAWCILSCIVILFWHHPKIGIALFLSATPLWVILVMTVLVASHDQKQQYDRYWVMDYQGQIIGCGRIDIHKQHSEIYDLFVLPEWRSCGIGQAIMHQLMAQAIQPIYLASLPKASSFYLHLGFQPVNPKDLPILLTGRLSLNSPRYRRVGLQPLVFQGSVRHT
ncbi:GNAT family N-acetyltransferase [filamentous cyanobacterium LEGE 11480]|uniref:GNAT family N-acetyltransferase n=1 Tax=Romeriopsis navalis LEGE 11480 TaxID=2777977 RepID=A0A928Z4L0_9CYAN|nr:GNAT family N-acetyltransferase [Romeriopsis navalis]MBE9030320.1 GNAT family N-acetyltransferase [Romeriopsis navalis LEGE 11480]